MSRNIAERRLRLVLIEPVSADYRPKRALPNFGRLKLTGFPAGAVWSIAHISLLIGFRNRLLVAMNWGWNYVTFQRGTRLITGASGSRAEEAIRPQSHLDAHESAA